MSLIQEYCLHRYIAFPPFKDFISGSDSLLVLVGFGCGIFFFCSIAISIVSSKSWPVYIGVNEPLDLIDP